MRFIALIISIFLTGSLSAQRTDSLIVTEAGKIRTDKRLELERDSIQRAEIRRTVLRSAMVPGWGQIDNKKIWKVPIIYGGLGTVGYLFVRNLKQYREARDAFRLASDDNEDNDYLIPEPYYSVRSQPQRIQVFRNSVRQNVDYSVLAFIGVWALNVADAAVDANLRHFDVSDDISLRLKAGYSPMAHTAGLQMQFIIKDKAK